MRQARRLFVAKLKIFHKIFGGTTRIASKSSDVSPTGMRVKRLGLHVLVVLDNLLVLLQ
jgi:hypothetical protein